MHTYDDRPCADCGDLDGCHIPGKVKRTRDSAMYGQQFPKIVCLCGSTRFGDAYREAMRAETLEGNIVLTVGLLGHAEGIDMDGPVKAMLDELHLRKIDHADEVLVLNALMPRCVACGATPAKVSPEACACHCGRCGSENIRSEPYIGASTRREIEYAKTNNKRLRWLNPPQD